MIRSPRGVATLCYVSLHPLPSLPGIVLDCRQPEPMKGSEPPTLRSCHFGSRGKAMGRLSQRHVLLAWVLIAAGAGSVRAFPPQRAFDPRPLMPAVEARAKQGHFRFIVCGDSKNNPPFTAVLEKATSFQPNLALSTGDLVDRGAGPRGGSEYDRLAEMAGGFMRRVPTWP